MYSDVKCAIKDFKFKIELYESCSQLKIAPRKMIAKVDEDSSNSKLVWELYENEMDEEELEVVEMADNPPR
jgi:hypothetical protein